MPNDILEFPEAARPSIDPAIGHTGAKTREQIYDIIGKTVNFAADAAINASAMTAGVGAWGVGKAIKGTAKITSAAISGLLAA